MLRSFPCSKFGLFAFSTRFQLISHAYLHSDSSRPSGWPILLVAPVSAAMLQLIMKSPRYQCCFAFISRLLLCKIGPSHLYRQAVNLYKSFAFWLTYRISLHLHFSAFFFPSWPHMQFSVKIKLGYLTCEVTRAIKCHKKDDEAGATNEIISTAFSA